MKRNYAIGVAAMLIIGAAFLLSRGSDDKEVSSTSIVTSKSAVPQVSIGGTSLESTLATRAEVSVSNTERTHKLNDQHLSDIRISQIQKVESFGSQNILVFKDGSELSVTRSMMADLPDNIRYQLEYSRDQ